MTNQRYSIINSVEKLQKMINLMDTSSEVAIDTETTGLNPLNDTIVGISICFNDITAFYIPIQHDDYLKNLQLVIVLKHLKPALRKKLMIFHNAKFDLSMFKTSGWEIPNHIFDTMIADYLLDSSLSHTLDACSLRELNIKKIPTEELIGAKGAGQKTFNELDVEKVAIYACEDAWCTYQLYKIYNSRLRDNQLFKLFNMIEMPLVRILMNMELQGVYCDTRELINEKIQLRSELLRLKEIILQKVEASSGRRINLNSTTALSDFLYKDLRLPITELTETGQPSVASSVLKRVAKKNSIVKKIYEYKKKSKTMTFLDKLPKQMSLKTGRIHGRYHQAVVRTGRLSSSSPNLQNIPAAKRDENEKLANDLGTKIRKSFKAQNSDYSILAADYSQVELRLLAILSKEQKMIQAFNDGVDIHRQTASSVNNVSIDKVTTLQRKQAKGVNFGINYGMGATSLSDRIGVTKPEAQAMIDKFFITYPKIKLFQNNNIQFALQHSFIKTLYGRRRFVPNIKSSDRGLSSYAERVAKNTPIQGAAADIMKIAMIRVAKFIQDKANEIVLVLQIHDELVFEVRNDKAEYYRSKIKEIMEDSFKTKQKQPVLLEVEVKYADNWAEAH